MAYGLPHSIFDQMDANHDGKIDHNEIRNFMLFKAADRNNDGRITLQEFAQGAAPQLGIRPKEVRAAFQAADTNNDGVLTQEELNNFADFKRADLNGDGRVDPYEMQQYRKNNQIGFGFVPPPPLPGKTSYTSYKYSYTSSYKSHA